MKFLNKFYSFYNKFFSCSKRYCSYQKSIDESIDEQFHFLPLGKSDVSMQTRISFIKKEMNNEKLVGISTISPAGFRLNNGHFMFGSITVFPKTVFSWRITKPEDITPKSLELFFLLQPKLDILIIGVGNHAAVDKVRKQIIPALDKHKIAHEILSTEFAISSFNFLNSDKRYVAAALLPPENIVIKNFEYGKALNLVRDYFENNECPLFMGVKTTHDPIQDAVNNLFADFSSEEREAAKKRVCQIRDFNKKKKKDYFDYRLENIEPKRLKDEIELRKKLNSHIKKKI